MLDQSNRILNQVVQDSIIELLLSDSAKWSFHETRFRLRWFTRYIRRKVRRIKILD